MLISLSKPNV